MARPASTPRFSIVTAVYDVERYLPEFIESIERQTFDLARVEVIVVDDGSSDGSLAQLHAWAARRPELVRVETQANAGQGAARNAGMALATGEWVTFPDPDDVVDANYLEAVNGFLVENPDADMVATNRLIWDEATGTLRNTHPLETFFRYDRLVDLEESDSRFHGSAAAAFFRRSVIRGQDLEYDTRLRPIFEDGHFTSRYLLGVDRPHVGFLQSARYHFRKRDDHASPADSTMLDPGRYTAVLTHGYLDLLDTAERVLGHVPEWLKHLLCYEVAGLFREAQRSSAAVIASGPLAEALHDKVRAVLVRVDPERVLRAQEYRVPMHARLAAMYGYRDERWCQPAVLLDKVDTAQRLVRARYRYTGARPEELVHNGDAPSPPRHAKVRDLVYFGRPLLHERILWLRYHPDLRIRLDGEWMPLVDHDPAHAPPTKATPKSVRRWLLEREDHERATAAPDDGLRDRLARRLASLRPASSRYAGAWVLMDRIQDAGDSAEILFKHLRREHPEINAWFVLRKDTADFGRLRTEGYADRLVAHGSHQWRRLMLSCAQLLSSHADLPVLRPPEISRLTEPSWRFTFLQHGVIKDDLSRWLNHRDIDLFVTSTVAEHASIAGDHSPYPFTTKEVVLTGLPRFDRLLQLGSRFPAPERDLLLATPTWRSWLVQGLEKGSQERRLASHVLETQFVREWVGLLSDEGLARACHDAGVQLALLAHPNLQLLVPQLDLPEHVKLLTYERADVQEYFARARVLLTDYSSIAFNAAYLERPVVYFQFDAEAVLAGAHVGRPGYFDYGRDGFGPVATDRERTVSALVEALATGGEPSPIYRSRIEAAFPTRDGGCSERVVQSVLASTLPDTGAGQVPTPVVEAS